VRRTRSTERGHVGAIAPAQDQEVVLALQVVAKGQTEPAVLVLAAVPYRHKPERLNGDVLVNRVQVWKPEQLRAPVRHKDVHRRVLREGGGDRSAKATDLKEGQRVIGDYTGYAFMESYPTQTSARTITILGSS
jgi:hypothetical protein